MTVTLPVNADRSSPVRASDGAVWDGASEVPYESISADFPAYNAGPFAVSADAPTFLERNEEAEPPSAQRGMETLEPSKEGTLRMMSVYEYIHSRKRNRRVVEQTNEIEDANSMRRCHYLTDKEHALITDIEGSYGIMQPSGSAEITFTENDRLLVECWCRKARGMEPQAAKSGGQDINRRLTKAR